MRILVANLLVAASVHAVHCSSARASLDTARVALNSVRPAAPARPDTASVARVPILIYHSIARHHTVETGEQRELDVDTAVFQRQMEFLAAHRYTVVPLGDLVDAIEGRRTLPGGAVVITFDDGWKDQHDIAFPILQRLGFTATFFIDTTAIGVGPGFMTWDDLRQMQRAGMTIGAHSRTHPDLTDRNVSLQNEVAGSRTDIARNIGVSPELFAYPYGAWNDRVTAAVRDAGFRAARGTGEGPNSRSDLFALRGFQPTDDMAAFERAVNATTARP